ncbi:MAG: transketolase [Paracoccaceae bacterium]|nr:transketolase [Paracoccaceae bacterium]MDG1319429.1 transketolase [Paracoccaceae bacterium]
MRTDRLLNSFDEMELMASAKSIRQNIVRMVSRNGQGYLQQGLGAADLFTYLYFAEVSLDIHNPAWEERDRVFLSTAHNSALFHAVLAERGFFEHSRLETYTKDGSELEINVSERLGSVVEATCGSLGQALSVAVGVAQAAKRQNRTFRSYVILGDGELQEGQVWEAAMYAASNSLDNLCLIVDLNQLQVEGHTQEVMVMDPIDKKFQAFGWAVKNVDGHDFGALSAAFNQARSNRNVPTVILAHTIVGKGIPFLENQMSHNMVLPADVAEQCLKALECQA